MGGEVVGENHIEQGLDSEPESLPPFPSNPAGQTVVVVVVDVGRHHVISPE